MTLILTTHICQSRDIDDREQYLFPFNFQREQQSRTNPISHEHYVAKFSQK